MAKIVIEIDDKTFGRIFHRDCIGQEYDYEVTRAIVNGTKLPDNATNGDVIQTMYSHYTFEIESFEGFVRCSYDGWYIKLPISWWNALYKAGDTDESDAEFMCRVMSKTINKSTDDRNFIGGF